MRFIAPPITGQTPMHDPPQTASARRDVLFARAMGLAWPLQCAVLAIWIAVPHPSDSHDVLLALMTLAALPLYLPLLVQRRPVLTRKGANIAMVLGVVQMGAMVWAGGGLASGFELMPLWFVPVTVCLVPRIDVVAEIATVAVGAGVAALIEAHTTTSTGEDPMLGFAVLAMATLIVNTAVATYVYSELQTLSERFRRRSVEDPLTGLANRPAVASYVAGCSAGDGAAAFVIDIDGFKIINDSLGPRTGDRLLEMLGGRLRWHARAGDLLARPGSDEFVLIARGVDSSEDALGLADRLLDVCDEPFALENLEAHMSVSVGVALLRDAASAEEALRNADLALDAAKSEHHGTAKLFEVPMREHAVTRLTIEHHLRRALERDEMFLVFQPILAVPARTIVGVEALLRWHSPELGDVSPTEFVPIAERTRLILPIGRFVLTRSIEQLAQWRRAGHDVTIAVNLSAGQLVDELLPDLLAALLASHAIPPDRVYLELTETALMEHAMNRPLAILDRLRATGVSLALDDFGTGYSSLSRLSQLRLRAVKIDRSFVARMLTDPAASAIVGAVLRMSEPMGVSVIAEGVETEEQLARLTEMGCNFAQGYLFARPLEPHAAVQLISRQSDGRSQAA